MRPIAGAAVVLLVVLAGCSAPAMPGSPTGTPTPSATPPATTSTGAPPDPASDRLGWENGYWHNESIDVDNSDGLDERERRAVVSRSMARVEVVRELEFTEELPVEVITRDEYRNRSVPEYTETFRTFDDAKFEALFLVGEDADSLDVQNENRGSTVLGYYSPSNDTIVLVSDTGQPQFDGERTLAHELVHAIQDQHYNLSTITAETRDGYNGQNGVIEGDANFVQDRYLERCGATWDCLERPTESGGGGGDIHLGIYLLNYFPYTDGPGFVDHHYRRGGWDAVNALYENLPESAEQVIYPERYGSDPPTAVTLRDSTSNGWERVRPEPPREGQVRPDHATVGQSGLTTMFAYTLYDEYNSSRVVAPGEVLNYDPDGDVNRSDPFNYDIAYTEGWEGDRMHVYSRGEETAYVWRLAWDSPAEAAEFAAGYRELLAHWGGERVEGDTWRVDESQFADAFYLEVDGDTVTVVNAPEIGDLGDVYAGAG